MNRFILPFPAEPRSSVQEFMRQRDHVGLFSEWEGNLLSSERGGVGRVKSFHASSDSKGDPVDNSYDASGPADTGG